MCSMYNVCDFVFFIVPLGVTKVKMSTFSLGLSKYSRTYEIRIDLKMQHKNTTQMRFQHSKTILTGLKHTITFNTILWSTSWSDIIYSIL